MISRCAGVLGQVAVGIQSQQLLALREDVAHGDRLLRPCLEDPGPDGAEVRVLLVSQTNEGVEDGVLEDLPPVAVARRGALDSGVACLDPLRRHGRRRPAIIRPDLESVVNPLPEVVRDTPAREQSREHQAGQRDPSRQARSRMWASLKTVGESPLHGSSSIVQVRPLRPAKTLRPADRARSAQTELSAESALRLSETRQECTTGPRHRLMHPCSLAYSAPMCSPFSATDRFMSSTRKTSATARTANSQKSSK